MSFQGDVAGIGLGELLQGLARGERNGVLTLAGRHLLGTVGLRKGQLYLLPGPDEDDTQWRDRCVRAFAEDENGNLESARRQLIARAARLETFYQMIEAPNLHFRFDPGPLPPPAGAGVRSAEGVQRGHRSLTIDTGAQQEYSEDDSSPWGQGMPVEYLLLEHARIMDEVRTGLGAQLAGFDLPRALDPERQDPEMRDFLEQCNGSSTVQEIADRLGWPLSKCRAHVGEYLQLERELAYFAGLPGRSLARRAVDARLEARIAQPVPAAARHQQLLALTRDFADDLGGHGFHHLRPHGYRQEHILALLAAAIGPAALFAVLRLEPARVPVIGEGVQPFAPDEIDAAAIAAIAAIRPAERDEFLAPERQRAVTTAAGQHANRDFIDEFHNFSFK